MNEIKNSQKMGFQTEVKQLLKLMIHSLYSNKEIFLRELVSNAADATDKARFESINDSNINTANFKIQISIDKEQKTISIEDFGIGMSKDETINHLGTIAKSGTAEFLSKLSEEKQKDASLIGQFGVGFYSGFIVANKMEVFTRRANLGEKDAVYWSSTGEGDFEIADIEKENIGTKIVLHIKEDSKEFLEDYKIRSILTKYSDHISIPIEIEKFQTEEEINEKKPKEWEKINKATALWLRPKSELKDEDYKEFYKTLTFDFSDPLIYVHNKVEGKLDYTSLLYIPSKAPFDLYQRDGVRGLKLFVQKVFIMDSAEEFLPLYLRFVKGIIDSNDLSLNVSREILQKDSKITSMKAALTKRVLDMLSKLSANKEEYSKFYEVFGNVLKEGLAEDHTNKEQIANLLRFSSTKNNKKEISFSEYISKGEEKIYFLVGDSLDKIKNNPALEIFKKKDIEVLLLTDNIDEWMISYLPEFEGKKLVDISRDNSFEDENLKEEKTKMETEHKSFLERVQNSLKDKIDKVNISTRLTDSPAILILPDNAIGLQMRQIMAASGQSMPDDKPILEINTNHPLMRKLDAEPDEDKFNDFISVIFDQASIASGREIKDPGQYVYKLNQLLLELL